MTRTFDLGLFSAQRKGIIRLQPMSTIRWPANVSYLVDNLWEWVRFHRHNNYPSRRYARYAWHRKETADEYAKGRELAVYRVVFDGKFKLCQVRRVPDSKEHPDCNNLPKEILNCLTQQGFVMERGWTAAATPKVKEDIGRLWIPALTPEELHAMSDSSEAVRHLLQEVEPKITYWKEFLFLDENSAEMGDGSTSLFDDGEIFFEPTGGCELVGV